MDIETQEDASERRYENLELTEKEGTMSDTKNFFEQPNSNGSSAGWGAGVGGLIGAAIGNGGFGAFGGNREPAVTPDQLGTAINGLQTQLSTDALQAQLGRVQGQIASSSADSTIALGVGIAGVKDAVVAAAGQNALSLCGLGHTMQAGFASINQTVLLEGAKGRELTLSENLAATRAALAAAHNDAGHKATQVLVSQALSVKGA